MSANDKPGYYWTVTINNDTPVIRRFDGVNWWGEMGRVYAKVEVISDRLATPVKFEVEVEA